MNKHLGTYLNDHLAGSVAGLGILDYIIEKSYGSADQAVLTKIRDEIEEDKQALEAFIEDCGFGESALRKASAWIGEKMAELKLRFDDTTAGPFLIFELLELLYLGVEGKLSLWRMLEHVLEPGTTLGRFDLQILINRAEHQRKLVDDMRLNAGRKAFDNV